MKITCKPCFAFDVLCAFAHSSFPRGDLPLIEELVGEINQGVSPSSVSMLCQALYNNIDHDKLQKITINDLIEIFLI